MNCIAFVGELEPFHDLIAGVAKRAAGFAVEDDAAGEKAVTVLLK
ncbi:MAG: hypothetical protein NTY38_33040 [Acidobacteria bacterium]|nr:hypothetical protein [Acidobacteriota bacterium]